MSYLPIYIYKKIIVTYSPTHLPMGYLYLLIHGYLPTYLPMENNNDEKLK